MMRRGAARHTRSRRGNLKGGKGRGTRHGEGRGGEHRGGEAREGRLAGMAGDGHWQRQTGAGGPEKRTERSCNN